MEAVQRLIDVTWSGSINEKDFVDFSNKNNFFSVIDQSVGYAKTVTWLTFGAIDFDTDLAQSFVFC